MAGKAKREKELTRQDFPVATGQATHPKCICWFGWVCEYHRNQPWEHDGCGGAGAPCRRKNCPYNKRRPPVRITKLPDKRVIH
jgi:hypothetical protein